jgi:peptidoglycan/xylan/chitin deacetylase (PgdA/CDA1 family)
LRPAELACLLLRLTGLPRLARELLQRRRVTILFYHRPAPAVFAAHMRALRGAYSLVALDDVVAALERGTTRDLPPKPLVVTFDDGHCSNHALLDVFKTLPAPPTVFLCSDLVDTGQPFWFDIVADPEPLKRIPDEERLVAVRAALRTQRTNGRTALSSAEIEELKPFVDFQSHTASHPILPCCSAWKAMRELADSRARLEERHGLRVRALAYPNGSYTQREIRLARQTGYRCAVTVDFGFNGPAADPMRLRRIAVNDDRDGAHAVMVKACGLWGVARTAWIAARVAGGHRR